MYENGTLKEKYYGFWSVTYLTRLGTAFVVLSLSFFDELSSNQFSITLLIFLYLATLALIGFSFTDATNQDRTRVLTNLTDVLYTTALISLTGGHNSPWFLLYIFPILYTAKRPSRISSMYLAVLIASGYMVSMAVLYTLLKQPMNEHALIARGGALIAVGVVGNELATLRKMRVDLIRAIKEINEEIVQNKPKDQILQRIAESAQFFTKSDGGQISLSPRQTSDLDTISIGTLEPQWDLQPLIDQFSRSVMASKKANIVQAIRGAQLRSYSETDLGTNLPRLTSFMFIPLQLENRVLGALCVYVAKGNPLTRWSLHTDVELGILELFGSLTAMALRMIEDTEEKKKRLQVLRELGARLTSTPDLEALFDRVVTDTCHRLNSEEAALFIPKDGQLHKVAVGAPSETIQQDLLSVKESYLPGESYVGSIFAQGKFTQKNNIPDHVKFVGSFAKKLPSGKPKHYIGVPLIMDKEVLGVLRVINKRSAHYAVEQGLYEIEEEGFRNEDVELLETIASLIAIAIRNAQLLKNLSQTKRFYQNLVINSPDPIVAIDENGKITIFNRACTQLLGYTYEEARGTPVTQIYESGVHAREVGMKMWKNKDHRIQGEKARIRDKHGMIIPIELSASFLVDDEGKRIGSVGIFKDLRERAALQQRTLEYEKLALVGRLARTVGHDIKHEIGTVRLYLETLAHQFLDDDELLDIFDRMSTSLHNSVVNLQEMLIAGKPPTLRKEKYNVEDLLIILNDILARQAEDRDIDLNLSSPDASLTLNVDIELMNQVFSNLFTNSVSAIETRRREEKPFTKGTIDVSVRANEEEANIMWRDNGCGIAEKDLPQIFDAFFTRNVLDSGTGLGLHNVKNIIEEHGGTISAASVLGDGASFLITLPRLKDAMP